MPSGMTSRASTSWVLPATLETSRSQNTHAIHASRAAAYTGGTRESETSCHSVARLTLGADTALYWGPQAMGFAS
jgi:hypothetical protein